jgi:hypothetical protein
MLEIIFAILMVRMGNIFHKFIYLKNNSYSI